jgi:hypothetical protein
MKLTYLQILYNEVLAIREAYYIKRMGDNSKDYEYNMAMLEWEL